MFTVIKGDNNNLEHQLVKALFGEDEKLIQQIIEQLKAVQSNESKLALVIDNTKDSTLKISEI